MRKSTSIFLFLFIISSYQNILADWVKTSAGINGGYVYSLALIGNDIAAGTESHGLFFSTNHGANWIESSLYNISVYSMAVDGSTVLAGTNNGVYISTDYGANWSQTALNMGNEYSILKKDSFVFVGTDGGVYRSSNLGQTWGPTSLMGFPILSLNVQDDKIFAGADYNYGVYVTTDNGANWVQTGLDNRDVNNIYISGQEFFACTDDGIYISTNSGVNWTQIGLNTIEIYSFTKIGSLLVAGWQNGIYRSTNNGYSWNQIPLGNNIEVHSLISVGADLFAGTNKNGIYKSVDSGSNWSQTPFENVEIAALCKGGSNLYSGTNDKGIFLSTNYGLNWSQIGFSNNSVLALTANDTELFVSPYYNYGIYKSTNYGVSWVFLRNLPVYSFAMVESRIYAGTYASGLYYSTDNGDNWFLTSLNFTDVFSLAAYGPNVYAGTWGLGLYCSTNYGTSWINVLTNDLINTIFTDETNVFVGTQNGLFISSNNGINWFQTGFVNEHVISVTAVGSNVIAATDSNGVYFSSNNGMNWSSANEGFNHRYIISSLVILNDFIYAGTSGFGVWRRNISELIGVNQSSTEVPNHFSLSQNYPNPFNPVTKIKFGVVTPLNPPFAKGGTAKTGGFVRLVIYDVLGREVAMLVNKQLSPGTYEVEWNGTNLPSGVYFYKLITEGFTVTKKMVLLK